MDGRVGADIGIKLLPVMWVCLSVPRHIHCSCSMVMAQAHSAMLQVNKLVSCAFSPIPINMSPFRIFHLLVLLCHVGFTCGHDYYTR